MTHHAAVKLIADSLHELTTNDGSVLRDNMLIPSKAMPQDWHDGVTKVRQGRAEGIVNLIESAGGRIVMPGDQTATPEPPQWVDVKCTTCHNLLMRVNLIRPDTSGQTLIGAMHNLTPECPHHPDAERQ